VRRPHTPKSQEGCQPVSCSRAHLLLVLRVHCTHYACPSSGIL